MNRISYSQLSMFSECPKRWKLNYIDKLRIFESGIHLIFGTAMHEVLQKYLEVMYYDTVKNADKLPLEEMLRDNLIKEFKKAEEEDGKPPCTKKDIGEFKKGFIKAELDVKDSLWFFECHFKDDSVMPGCLGLDAMWQLVGFYLGWLGNPGKGRALGVGTVKFTGEVLQDVKNVRYEISMKKIMSPVCTTVGLANGIVFADNKKIYSADSLKVGLFK